MFASIEYRLLKHISPSEPRIMSGEAYAGKSKFRVLLGEKLTEELMGKDVIDFGCGTGEQAIELAISGARRVVGIDIQTSFLQIARDAAATAGVADRCQFATHPTEPADAVVSIDSFEHFSDPAAILQTMFECLKPGGAVFLSFGPTWYHPLGGHLFSIFPWAHLIFSEQALIRWRSDIRSDGGTRFSEVEGGLNQMTIARFEQLVSASRFDLGYMDLQPIRSLRSLHNSWTREFTTAIVRAKLTRPEQA